MREIILNLIDKLETYNFHDEIGHPLQNCKDWHDLKDNLGYFEEADIAEAQCDLGNNIKQQKCKHNGGKGYCSNTANCVCLICGKELEGYKNMNTLSF